MLTNKPARRTALLIALLGALTLSGCNSNTAASAAGSPPPAAVTVVTLKPQEVTLTRELPGRVAASLVAEVRPQVNGIVKERLFVEGSQVKAGQALYALDDAVYKADVANARAALARAQATMKSAELLAQRSAELVKIDAVSRQDNESAAAAYEQARADVAAARAALQRSEVTLGYARIVSPISGQIGKSSVTRGALVTANQANVLATVQQLDPMYIDLTQSSRELLQLRKDMAAGKLGKSKDVPVKILLEDGSVYQHAGKLAFTDVTVDQGTGSFAVRVTVPNPDKVLLPGMYLRAVMGNGQKQAALLVPQQGITRDPKGNASAVVVNAQGKAEVRTVQVSRTVGDQWLVDGGLAAGDKVIVEGLQKIRPGAPVAASEAGAPAAASAPAASATAAH